MGTVVPDSESASTGMSPMQEALVRTPLAALNTSRQGRALTRRLRSFVTLPVQPESGCAKKSRDPTTEESCDLSGFGRSRDTFVVFACRSRGEMLTRCSIAADSAARGRPERWSPRGGPGESNSSRGSPRVLEG